jgi:hypothetical protein
MFGCRTILMICSSRFWGVSAGHKGGSACLEALVLQHALDGGVLATRGQLRLEDDSERAVADDFALGVGEVSGLSGDAILDLFPNDLFGSVSGATFGAGRERTAHPQAVEGRRARLRHFSMVVKMKQAGWFGGGGGEAVRRGGGGSGSGSRVGVVEVGGVGRRAKRAVMGARVGSCDGVGWSAGGVEGREREKGKRRGKGNIVVVVVEEQSSVEQSRAE